MLEFYVLASVLILLDAVIAYAVFLRGQRPFLAQLLAHAVTYAVIIIYITVFNSGEGGPHNVEVALFSAIVFGTPIAFLVTGLSSWGLHRLSR